MCLSSSSARPKLATALRDCSPPTSAVDHTHPQSRSFAEVHATCLLRDILLRERLQPSLPKSKVHGCAVYPPALPVEQDHCARFGFVCWCALNGIRWRAKNVTFDPKGAAPSSAWSVLRESNGGGSSAVRRRWIRRRDGRAWQRAGGGACGWCHRPVDLGVLAAAANEAILALHHPRSCTAIHSRA